MAFQPLASGAEDAGEEAWIEAELERELLALGPLEGDSDSDESLVIGNRAASVIDDVVDDSNLLREALPASFQEFMQCVEDEDVEFQAAAEAEAEDLQLIAALEAPLAPVREAWVPEDLSGWNEDDQELLGAALEEVRQGRKAGIRPQGGPRVSEMSPEEGDGQLQEVNVDDTEMAQSEAASEACMEGEECEHDSGGDGVGGDTGPTDADLVLRLEEEQQRYEDERQANIAALEREHLALQERLWHEAEERRLEEQRLHEEAEQQRLAFEAERARRVAELELEQERYRAEMRLREQRRREEEEQVREISSMQMEERRCRDFYSTERSAEHRERRHMVAEDRRGMQVRQEERRARENMERGREMEERTAMGRQDAFAARLRDAEKEAGENRKMRVEDNASARLRVELRRLKELSDLSLADAESFRWRDAQRALEEIRRMSKEDASAQIMRQCGPFLGPSMAPSDSGPAVAVDILNLAEMAETVSFCRSSSSTCTGTVKVDETAESAIAALVRSGMPATSRTQTSAVASLHDRTSRLPNTRWTSQDVKASTKADLAGEKRRGTTFEGLRCAARRIDPVAELFDRMSHSAGGSHRCKTEATASFGVPPRPNDLECSCSGLLCKALREGAERWRNGASSLVARGRELAVAAELPAASRCLSSTSACPASVASGIDDHEELERISLGTKPRPSRAERMRADLKMENLETVPGHVATACVRVLGLTGNRLRELGPLRSCLLLEELSVCQQAQGALSSLAGLESCARLSVLRATQNSLRDTEALARLDALRQVELAKNSLSSVRLHAPGLAKLDLYRNELSSVAFLEHLPSLTYLDVGRNRLTEIDSRISDWCPFLLRLRLHENRLRRLPALALPLLTEIGVDNNELETLGPLGFLPSLERLSAAHNKISSLGRPIAASPLLHTLTCSFNLLASAEAMEVVFLHARLRKLQLGDNPCVAEMMETYRPWVLRKAPQLEELDNDVIGDDDRLAAAAARAVASTRFAAYEAAVIGPLVEPSARKPPQSLQRRCAEGGRGLLGLVGLRNCGGGEAVDSDELGGGDQPRQATAAQPSLSPGLSGLDVLAAQRAAMLSRWCADVDGGVASAEGSFCEAVSSAGCSMCSLALYCEAAGIDRGAAVVTHNRNERQAAAQPLALAGDSGRSEILFVLRRRGDFWKDFLALCADQCEALAAGCKDTHAWRTVSFRERGGEAAALRLALRCQALWRGVSLRRGLVASGVQLPGTARRALRNGAAMRLQASIRGSKVRRRLRAAREASRALADVLDECPEIDVDAMLNLRSFEFPEPLLSLRVPEAQSSAGVAAAPPSSVWQASLESGRGGAAAAPREAWHTPPATAGARPSALGTLGAPSPPAASISPASSRPGTASGGLGRCRSLSSTAESAVLESDGLLRHDTALERVKTEWGFENDASAQAYLAAQRRMKLGAKPPKPPAKGFGAASSRASAPGRSGGSLRGAHSQPPRQAGASQGSLVKAQDAIAAARLLQEQGEVTGDAREFRSGEPNKLLLRSSRSQLPQTPPNAPPASPRVGSPKRGGLFR